MTSPRPGSISSVTGTSRQFGYLERLRARRFRRDLQQTIVFGYVLGFLMLLVFSFQWRYTHNWSDELMVLLALTGVAMIAITLVAPTVLNPARLLWVKLTGKIGAALFGFLLAILFLLALTPLGWYRRFRRGTAPFYTWVDTAPPHAEGWVRKSIPAEVELSGSEKPLPLILQPIRVITYFLRRGEYAIIPLIVLLALLGLVMFFVQSSSLAPFIYTLF